MAKDIETYIEELKAISRRLGDGEIKLGEAVELYKKGEKTAREAEKLLQAYENELEIVGGEDDV